MTPSSRNLDRLQAIFDHDGIVANAGLILPATLMARLGLEALIDMWEKTGSTRPGRKILTVVAAMIVGGRIFGTCRLVAGSTRQSCAPFVHSLMPDHSTSRSNTADSIPPDRFVTFCWTTVRSVQHLPFPTADPGVVRRRAGRRLSQRGPAPVTAVRDEGYEPVG